MSEEKVQTKIEEVSCDHATEESGEEIDERKLLRKIDLHLLPMLTLLFLLSFLDRSNGNRLLSPFVCLPLIPLQLEMLVSKVWPRTCT